MVLSRVKSDVNSGINRFRQDLSPNVIFLQLIHYTISEAFLVLVGLISTHGLLVTFKQYLPYGGSPVGNAQECFTCTPHLSRTSSVDTTENATELVFSRRMKSVGLNVKDKPMLAVF